jgi:periplasmic protein TonB
MLLWTLGSLGLHLVFLVLWPLPAVWRQTRPTFLPIELFPETATETHGQTEEPGLGDGLAKSLPASLSPAVQPPQIAKPKKAPQQPMGKPPQPKPSRPKTSLPIESQPTPSALPSGESLLDAPQSGSTAVLATSQGRSSNGMDGSGTAEGTPGGTGIGTGVGGEVAGAGAGIGGQLQAGMGRASPLGYAFNPKPAYPVSARRKGWEGEVLLRVRVSSAGKVEQVQLEKTSGYGILDRSASQAVSRWTFRPARRNGQPIADTVLVPVRFELQNGP